MRVCMSFAGSAGGLRDKHWRKPLAEQPDIADEVRGDVEVVIRAEGWMWKAAAVVLVALTAGPGCRKAKVDPFPATGAIAGWEKTDDTRVFAAKDLWQYIDGDAEHFVQAGVVQTATSDYTYNGKVEAVVDIHTMRNADGARKILETGLTHEAKTIALGDEGVQYAQSVSFRKGVYLVRIVAYESTEDTPQALLALAHGLENRL